MYTMRLSKRLGPECKIIECYLEIRQVIQQHCIAFGMDFATVAIVTICTWAFACYNK